MKLPRSRRPRRGRIEIIPMIDVMFFLVVTFMLASLSMQALDSLPVNLPNGRAQTLVHRLPLTVTVTRDRRIFVDRTPTSLGAMTATLRARLRGRADARVVVAADRDAPEGVVVQAMLAARRAGIRHVLIAVRHRS